MKKVSSLLLTPRSKIYVAGHRGMVGAAIVRKLRSAGYSNIVFRTHSELDLTDQRAVDVFFEVAQPDHKDRMGFRFLHHLIDEMNYFLRDGAVFAFRTSAKFVIKRIWKFLDVERGHKHLPIFHRIASHHERSWVVCQ